jgi:hypothetical protein
LRFFNSGNKSSLSSDDGVTDKRLLVVEGEFAAVLEILKREGNILSETMRNAWDTGDLRNNLVRNNPAKATGAHISVIGHITKEELDRRLKENEKYNGFVNRFLWVAVRRSRFLPSGGVENEKCQARMAEKLKQAIQFGKKAQSIQFDAGANEHWCGIYKELSGAKPGLLGSVTARGEAQVARLCCIYSLLDCSPVVRKEHLLAALEVWRYCKDSCRYIFVRGLGDPLAEKILEFYRPPVQSMNKTEIFDRLGRHVKKADLNRALGLLEGLGKLRKEVLHTSGRSVEEWSLVEEGVKDLEEEGE